MDHFMEYYRLPHQGFGDVVSALAGEGQGEVKLFITRACTNVPWREPLGQPLGKLRGDREMKQKELQAAIEWLKMVTFPGPLNWTFEVSKLDAFNLLTEMQSGERLDKGLTLCDHG